MTFFPLLSPCSQKFVQLAGSISFPLQLNLNSSESIILFIVIWIDYYQNDSASVWEKVGLHWVHTLWIFFQHFFSFFFFFLTTAVVGRKLKIGESRWQVCSGLCLFNLFSRRKATWKKYAMYTKLWQNWHRQFSYTDCWLDSLYITCLQIYSELIVCLRHFACWSLVCTVCLSCT